MIQVSDAYKELVKSNIRPKSEPFIKVSGKDNTGNDIELIWRANDIKNFTYKRGIDPVGRELPYMELTWTEVYKGKLTEENFPEKYKNIARCMKVDFSIIQDLGAYSQWKSIFNSGKTWKDFFSICKTWKNLKNQVEQENIKLPSLFLVGKPVFENQTITWTAKDILHFLTDENVKSFKIDDDNNEDYRLLKDVFAYFLINSRASFVNNADMLKAITQTANNILASNDDFKLEKNIIFDGSTKDILKNLASIENKFLNFDGETFYLSDFNKVDNQIEFNSTILYEMPKITRCENISGYSFKNYKTVRDNGSEYSIEAETLQAQYGENEFFDYYRWNFKSYGEVVGDVALGEINYAIYYGNVSSTLTVVPISFQGYDNFINNNKTGEIFNENNPLNVYDKDTDIAKLRLEYLNDYFNDQNSTIEFSALPNFSLEPSDILTVETAFYDENEQKTSKKAMAISFEISYNGAFKEKIICHEVQI